MFSSSSRCRFTVCLAFGWTLVQGFAGCNSAQSSDATEASTEDKQSATPPAAKGARPEGAAAAGKAETPRDLYFKKVRELSAAEDFDGLEKLVAEANTSRELITGAHPLILYYHELCSPQIDPDTKRKDWQSLFARLERWQKAKPKSATPRIAMASVYWGWGVEARGQRAASSVSPLGWELYTERYKKAEESLLRAKALGADGPIYCMLNIAIGKGLNWPKEQMLEFAYQSVKADPTFDAGVAAMASYLLPRWHGQPGELYEFANEVRRRMGGIDGEKMYARIAIEKLYFDQAYFFERTQFEYEDLKPGAIALFEATKDHQYVQQFVCLMACVAGDRETAHTMFTKLDDKEHAEVVWHGKMYMTSWRRWADPDRKESDAIKTLTGLQYNVNHCAFTPDGKTLVGGGGGDTCAWWDVESGERIGRVRFRDHVKALVLHPTKPHIYATVGHESYGQNSIATFDIDEQREQTTFAKMPIYQRCIAISPDGRFMATGGVGKQVRVFSLEVEGGEPKVLQHTDKLYTIAISPDSKTLVSSTFHGIIQLWDLETGEAKGEPLIEFKKGPWYTTVAFDPSGKNLYDVSMDGTIRRWELATKKLHVINKQDWVQRTSIAFSPDGAWMAVGRYDRPVELYETKTHKKIHDFHGHWGGVCGVQFSPDGRLLASSAVDSTIMLWDLKPYVAKNDE